jgi:hypothetical protein
MKINWTGWGTEIKSRVAYWWNTLLLNVAVYCVANTKREVVEANAIWDKAQDAAERASGKRVKNILDLAVAFEILAHRCKERAEDLVQEARLNADTVEQVLKVYSDSDVPSLEEQARSVSRGE